MSNYLIDELLNLLLRGTSFTPSASLYLALTTVLPSASDTGSTITEPSSGGYARQEIDPSTGNWLAPAAGCVANGVVVTWPVPSGSWGTIVGFAVVDASSAGNVYFFGPVQPAIVVPSGSVAWTFAVSQVQICLGCCC